MSVLRIASVVVVLAALLAASEARAATMTFDALPESVLSYFEDGITADGAGFDLGFFGALGRLHLDDSGTAFARRVDFHMAIAFRPVSFDILPVGTSYCPPDLPDPPCSTPYDNVRVTGIRAGAVVFEDLFSADEPGAPWTYFFPELDPIDSLSIQALRPDLDVLGGGCDDAPCSHFDIDNLVLVPGPVMLPQLTLALVALGARRLRLPAPDVRPCRGAGSAERDPEAV